MGENLNGWLHYEQKPLVITTVHWSLLVCFGAWVLSNWTLKILTDATTFIERKLKSFTLVKSYRNWNKFATPNLMRTTMLIQILITFLQLLNIHYFLFMKVTHLIRILSFRIKEWPFGLFISLTMKLTYE